MAAPEKKQEHESLKFSRFKELDHEGLRDWLLKLPFCKAKARETIKKAFDDEENPITGRYFGRCKNLNELEAVFEKHHASLGLTSVQAFYVRDYISFDDEGEVEGSSPSSISQSTSAITGAGATPSNDPLLSFIRTLQTQLEALIARESSVDTGMIWPMSSVETGRGLRLQRVYQTDQRLVALLSGSDGNLVLKLYHRDEQKNAENEAQILQYLGSNEWTVSLKLFVPIGQYFALLLSPVECEEHFLPHSYEELQEYTRQLFKALHFLHSYRIIHADIKLPNVLWNRGKRQLTIIDFGLSILLPADQHCWKGDIGGSYPYLAPEIRCPGINAKVTFAIDVWSAGVLISLLMGVPIKEANDVYGLLGCHQPQDLLSWAKRRHRCSSIAFLTRHSFAFLKRVLVLNWEHRPSASLILQHQFLTECHDRD